MQSRRTSVLIGVAALIVAVVLFVVLNGDDDSDSGSAAEIPTIVVENGEPVGGVQDLTFTEGDDIRFKVESDVADEVHFHGYDIGEDVEAGGSVTFDVPATITGKFEVELEERVTQIAEITVNPS